MESGWVRLSISLFVTPYGWIVSDYTDKKMDGIKYLVLFAKLYSTLKPIALTFGK